MDILIVEDNPDLVGNVYDFLDLNGHSVDVAYSAESGLQFMADNRYDVLILDWMLPGMSGLEMCRQLRQEGCTTPIIMLTARDALNQKIEGLAAGADDYLVKPFALLELEARLHALVRRDRKETGQTTLQVGPLFLDPQTYEAKREGLKLNLQNVPFQILEILMRSSPEVVTRQQISHRIWGSEFPDSDVLRTHIHALRTRVDKPFDKPMLHTIKGVGFRLLDPT